MNDFRRGGQKFGGNRDAKRGFGGGGRNGDRPAMHKAVCSGCGKDCEVPFRPSGAKPIFCSDCFAKQGDGKSRDRGPRKFEDRNSRPSFNNKPSYQNSASANTENYKVQFEQLNFKLDKILEIVATVVSRETQAVIASVKKPAAKEASAKPKTKKVIKKTTTQKKN